MFVKIYEYHINEDKVDEFLTIQERASEIYKQYLGFDTFYLNSKKDKTKWLEITKFPNEAEYMKSIELVNKHQEIQALFDAFQSLLVEKKEIEEEDFFIIKEIHA